MPLRARSIGLSGLVLVTTALAAALAWGQPGAALELRPRWKAGDTRAMELVRHRELTRTTGQTRRVTTRSPIDIRILAADADVSIVEWKVGEVRFDDVEETKDPGVAELLGMGHHVRYELEVDAAGAIRRLRNWTEVRDLARGATTRLLEQLRLRGMTGQTRSTVSERIGALYSSEQQILGYSLKEASLYHAAFGKPYTVSVPIRSSERLRNPLGGEPLPAEMSFTLTRLDEAPRAAVIEWKQALEPEATRRIMLKTLTDLAARMRQRPPSEADIPSVTIDGSAEIVVDPDTGWLTSLRMERTARLARAVQTDSSTLSERK